MARRSLLQGLGGALALPALESTMTPRLASAVSTGGKPPMRLLIVGNPLGAHPDHFFPKEFGTDFRFPDTLKSLEWLRGDLTILSHTDHHMKSGHGRELAFLSGVLPENAAAYPEKNMSVDQVIAREIGPNVRFPSIHASLEKGIRMVYNGNGVEIAPFTDEQSLYDHLFLNLNPQQREARKRVLSRNESVLDAVKGQFKHTWNKASSQDKQRLEQFATSVRDLERNLSTRKQWMDRDKPQFDLNQYRREEVTLHSRYEAIFDMVAYAFETDLTRVATIAFPNELNYTDIEGVNRGYHSCTHNGKNEKIIRELVGIESFQVAQVSRLMKKLSGITEPGGEGSMLDNTVVLYGSGMGYGGTHSNRKLPIFVAGGGFQHRGHVDTRDVSGDNMPLCNLFVTLMQKFGVERDRFNTSTGTFELG